MSDTLDPRIQAFLDRRGKLAPVGVRCVVTPLAESRYFVHAPGALPGGLTRDGDYIGYTPFTVCRREKGRDIVTVPLATDEAAPSSGPTYWEIIAPSTALFTQDPLPADVDPSDLPLGIEFTTTFSVQFIDWGSAPPFFPTTNPLYQIATVQPFYVIERWRDAAYAEDVGTGTIVPVLDDYVETTWTDTITIPPDAADPTGTYPNDSFKIRLYTDSSRSVEMLVITSA